MKNIYEKKDYIWGMLCHLLALTLNIGIPFGNIIGPFIIWHIKREESGFIDQQGKESLNFQITLTIYGVISGLLCLIFIGYIFIGILYVANIVLVVTASLKVINGESYKYPLTIQLIR